MANKPTIKLCKKSSGFARSAARAAVGDAIPSYLLQDNEDGSFNIFGVNSSGNPVDISGVASLTPAPTSSDVTTLTVDVPTGFLVQCHGLKAGHADVTVTATWNDGSVGPFTIVVPADVATSPAVGLGVTFNTPVIR